MELRQLEYLVAVVDEGGFTKAAAKMHVAQPGVSAQIKQLERELGERLLDRSGRTVRLTEVGRAVLPYARAALGAVAGARAAVDEFTGLLRGRVVMGGVTIPARLDLAEMLADFHERHPAVELSMTEMDPATLLDSLLAGRVDVGLTGLGAPLPPNVAAEVVLDHPLVVAVRPGHKLDGRSSITLAELDDLPLITLPRGTGLRTVLDGAFAEAGIRPQIAFEASEPYFLAELAAHGLGVTILPLPKARLHGDRLHVIELTRPSLRGQLGLIWRTDGSTSPAARALVAHARRHLAQRTRTEAAE
ncbi:LysR family transcriptional regulator [Nonomuraea longicatena]|uniref:LysR substrate-binding domain-containing protein n=2 Tax=Nonomuraea longicatena TaxID=83682 RepID=A0ABP4AM07_9ACTN